MAHRNKRPDKRRRYTYRMAGESAGALPIKIAMNRVALLMQHERSEIMTPVHAAFAALRMGGGNDDYWSKLADTMNVAADLAEHNIASDHVDTFEAGKAALAALMERRQAGGSWTLRGAEISALDLAVFVHNVQLQHCSRGELAASVGRVIARVQGALAGNASPGARVFTPGHLGAAAGAAA